MCHPVPLSDRSDASYPLLRGVPEKVSEPNAYAPTCGRDGRTPVPPTVGKTGVSPSKERPEQDFKT